MSKSDVRLAGAVGIWLLAHLILTRHVADGQAGSFR
jgi:hypothetical protein